jgi:hypothetical protein
MFSHSAVKCSPIQASSNLLVEPLDLLEIGLQRHADVRSHASAS